MNEKKLLCDTCGKPVISRTRGKVHHYCSNACRLKALSEYDRKSNPMNKRGGVLEARIKRGNALRNTGKGCSYRKLLGKHEHRVVAEEILGRPLLKGEVVHHIDGNKRNNTVDNLMILPSQSEHCKIHFTKRGDDACPRK